MAFTPPADSATELKPFTPSTSEAEELTPDTAVGSFLRGAKSKLASGVGGLLGAIAGAAAAGPESGFLLSVPAGAAGAAGGSALGEKFYKSLMGEEGMRREAAQLEANRLAGHGFAGGAGEMIPALLPAASTPTRAAGLLGRLGSATESGFRMGAAGEAAQQVDTGTFDPAALVTHPIEEAVKFGPVGLIPHANGILKSIAKGIPDAAVMTLSSNLYDHYVHGKPLSLEGYATETGESIPSFLLLNAITSLAHAPFKGMPKMEGKGDVSQAPEKALPPEGQQFLTEFKEPDIQEGEPIDPIQGPNPQKVTTGAFLPSAESQKEIIYPAERKLLEERDQDAFMQDHVENLPDQELLSTLEHVDQYPDDPRMVAFGDLLHEEGINRGIIQPNEAPVGPFPQAEFGRAPEPPEMESTPLEPIVPTPPLSENVDLSLLPEQRANFVQEVTQPPTKREAFKYANRPLSERAPELTQSNSERSSGPPLSPPSEATKVDPSATQQPKNGPVADPAGEYAKTKALLEMAKARGGYSQSIIDRLQKQVDDYEKNAKITVQIPGENKTTKVPAVVDGEPVLAPTTLAAVEKVISQAPETTPKSNVPSKPETPSPRKSASAEKPQAPPQAKTGRKAATSDGPPSKPIVADVQEAPKSPPPAKASPSGTPPEVSKEVPDSKSGTEPTRGSSSPASGGAEVKNPDDIVTIHDYNKRGQPVREKKMTRAEAERITMVRKATFDLLKQCLGA